MYYFISYMQCYVLEHTMSLKQSSTVHFAIVAKEGIFDLVLRRHHRWSVTSREREVQALWRHIRRLFLHAQIGTKAIFTSE